MSETNSGIWHPGPDWAENFPRPVPTALPEFVTKNEHPTEPKQILDQYGRPIGPEDPEVEPGTGQ